MSANSAAPRTRSAIGVLDASARRRSPGMCASGLNGSLPATASARFEAAQHRVHVGGSLAADRREARREPARGRSTTPIAQLEQEFPVGIALARVAEPGHPGLVLDLVQVDALVGRR